MSDWLAALAQGDTAQVWTNGTGPARSMTLAALSDQPLPVILAGLPDGSRPVPCVPMDSLLAYDAPHISRIPSLYQSNPKGLTLGAEVAISGYMADHADFDGVVLDVGAQTCWAHISAQEVVSFQCALTPELMHALGAAPTSDFASALDQSLSRPERLAQHLASARASDGDLAAPLIGAEIAAMKPYWLGQQVVVLGAQNQATPYVTALSAQAAMVETADREACLKAGFRRAWEILTTAGAASTRH